MNTRKIYVVLAEMGSYADYQLKNVCAFSSQEEAEHVSDVLNNFLQAKIYSPSVEEINSFNIKYEFTEPYPIHCTFIIDGQAYPQDKEYTKDIVAYNNLRLNRIFSEKYKNQFMNWNDEYYESKSFCWEEIDLY